MKKTDLPKCLGVYLDQIRENRNHTDIATVFGLYTACKKRFNCSFDELFPEIKHLVSEDDFTGNICNFLTGDIQQNPVGEFDETCIKENVGFVFVEKYIAFYHKENGGLTEYVDTYNDLPKALYISVEYIFNSICDYLIDKY